MTQEGNGYLPQYHSYTKIISVYQDVWVTRYSDWYVIVNVA